MPIPERVAGVKWQVWAIGGLASAGVVWWVYKRQSSKAAATDMTQTDPTIDPTTGLPYASEMYSGVPSSPSYGGIYDPSTGATIGTGGLGAPATVTSFGSAAEWGQAAVQRLIANGFEPVAATTAIGAYIAGINLTSSQYSIVQSAIGLTGYPPGNVPAPHMAPPSGQTNAPTPAKWGTGPHTVPGAFNSKVPVWYVNSLVQHGHTLVVTKGQQYFLGGHIAWVK